MNIFSKRLLLNKPNTIFEESTAGVYNMTLPAGRWEITAIGGGGPGCVFRSSVTGGCHWVQGGVGGTLQAVVNNYVDNDIVITIGAGGQAASGTFAASGDVKTGVAAGNTTITGIPGATIKAGAGTSATFKPTSSSAGVRTPGIMGTNTISGDAVKEILINNPTTIVSNEGASTATRRQPVGKPNANWEADNTRGKGGDGGWSGTSLIKMLGGAGYVRIRRL